MMGHGVFRLQSLCGLLCEGARFYSRTPVVKGFEVLQPAVNQQKRSISLSAVSRNGRSDEKLTVHFINQHNKKLTVVAEEDESLLDVVLNHNLDIEGFGSCEGTLACSTCHLIFDKENFDSLDKISVEELDMLDLAFGLTDTFTNMMFKKAITDAFYEVFLKTASTNLIRPIYVEVKVPHDNCCSILTCIKHFLVYCLCHCNVIIW
ncbi:ferredoxin 1b isoform X1 [Pristis pectinata]|uniref:ferredoxin 1b isoform X1 n=1 Tax=Pristis pectinata TaxID=685728 RepID=UPI00223E705C|nr:ferredoxin 1b isoform X1 [Pristis pectinata]